jgi:spore photoproduct lyase
MSGAIKHQVTKTLITKDNNNSANCIAPNLIYGCFGGCVDTYCYMSRYNGHRVFVNENVDEIFQSVVEWEKGYTKVPDQQDPKYTMVDIACNTDLVLMQKHLPEPLIDYLKRYDDHPQLNSTMATKYPSLLKLDVNHFNKKPRVRVSLMPQRFADVLEPKMQKTADRIPEINRLKDLGWEQNTRNK